MSLYWSNHNVERGRHDAWLNTLRIQTSATTTVDILFALTSDRTASDSNASTIGVSKCGNCLIETELRGIVCF